MQYKKSIFSASLIATSLASYVPSEPWETLTPSAAIPTGYHQDYTSTFGIAVVPITTGTLAPKPTSSASASASSSASKAKRDVVSQIHDGQIQATTSTAAPKPTAQVISQIPDGQIQATTATAKTVTVTVTEKPDCAPKTTANVISQIPDGQIQATTATVKPTDVVSQIHDGQIQATQSAKPVPTGKVTFDNLPESCLTPESLAITLRDTVLTDSAGRIGAIVSNRQFQFDGPPPQAGSIYAAGWSITPEGNLALGDKDVFYQCLSGTFYNLYDEHVAEQCTPIHLEIVNLVKC